MPKHAPTPHHRDGPGGKKKGSDENPRRHHLPTGKEMKKMSVREKLLAGVSFCFAETQQQQQQSYAPVASLQQSIDEAFRVSPSIHRRLNDSPECGTVMLREEVEEGLWEMAFSERRQILTDHFCRRMRQRQDTSRRLQAVMRQANGNPFAPPAEASCEQGPGEKLRLFLHSACREYGYRKLEIDICGFMRIKVSSDFRGEPLGSVPMPPTVQPEDNVILDARKGSITLYESDVPDQFGRITTWMWLKICRPLASYELRHHPAPDMSKEEEQEAEAEAWVIIAIPKSQLETLEDAWHLYPAPGKETNGDYIMESVMPHHIRQDKRNSQRRRGLAFRYSRDGVPGVATSKKTGDADSPWFGFRTDFDEIQWEMVQAAMKTNSCLVYALSTMDAEWIHVAAEQPEEPKQSRKRAAAQMSRETKRSNCARRSSSLKHEVHSED